ncbi:MAG: hypothetical protein HYX38_33005 [Rhodospirillales bacterium]|nr:hypothetical protein [Rhodospirillales bacterium]
MTRSLTALSLCLASMMLAPAVLAQTKNSVEVTATTGSPEFRDPKTGQVWTPETVGQDGRPIGPEDAAFDPRAQTSPMQAVLQKATARPVGSVPITAGPTVPIVVMENPTLRAIPGQRWQVVMYLNNNSGNTINPVVDCNFTNAGKPVTNTRAQVTQIGPGVRAGIVVMGPRTNFFVDKAACQVASP